MLFHANVICCPGTFGCMNTTAMNRNNRIKLFFLQLRFSSSAPRTSASILIQGMPKILYRI